jgi:hypothetical protein
MILSPQANATLYLPVVSAEWGAQDVALTLRLEDLNDESMLDLFKVGIEPVVTAYRFRVGLCRIVENNLVHEAGSRFARLRLRVTESDFTPSLEISLGSLNADKLAELRARRLLLNENPAVETTDINDITRELFLRGQDTYFQIVKSSFPELFKLFGANPARFLQIAWISAVTQLRLGACTETIQQLQLTLRGTSLDVLFKGKRKKQYVNAEAYEMRISGTCSLDDR